MDFGNIKIGRFKVALQKTNKLAVDFNYTKMRNRGKVTIKIFLLKFLVPTPNFLHIRANRLSLEGVYQITFTRC